MSEDERDLDMDSDEEGYRGAGGGEGPDKRAHHNALVCHLAIPPILH